MLKRRERLYGDRVRWLRRSSGSKAACRVRTAAPGQAGGDRIAGDPFRIGARMTAADLQRLAALAGATRRK
jgi:hypothetical protein